MHFLVQAVAFLLAAVIAVPLARRAGLGAVLGYLAAGVAVGPWARNLAGGVGTLLDFAELGVVLLLFVIGLELQPSRLWVLRKSVFGLGTAQVIVVTAALSAIGYGLGLAPAAALLAGFGLSLSSTAFVLPMLAERKQLTAHHGRASFAILLFQDLAAIPVLAVLKTFAAPAGQSASHNLAISFAIVIGVIAAMVFAGRYLLRPVLRLVATFGNQEIFTAAALLVVMGAALLVGTVGLSMALGAFIAGVLLADSEYRHELEADIEPFRGLLLGLYFMAVGMSLDLGLLVRQPSLVFGLAAGFMLVKFTLLYALGRLYRLPGGAARKLGATLSQGGEFAFVLFAAAAGYGLLSRDLTNLLVLVVTLSMAATPLLMMLDEKLLEPLLAREAAPPYDSIEVEDRPVIIAGFGRFGQIVSRVLRLRNIPYTALEISAAQVDFVRRFGGKLYYGDASRLELLRAAHTDRARAFVLAIDDVEASVATAETVRQHFPQLKIYARARNRRHAHRLMDAGAHVIQRETYLSSLALSESVLMGLGVSKQAAEHTVAVFRRHDEATLQKQYAVYKDEEKLIQTSVEAARELEQLFEQDRDAEPTAVPSL
jgi:glutathione-regulated potassium-efflux system ancillary protein KefC/glutathione-regulated potassium-efflux system protein KefB